MRFLWLCFLFVPSSPFPFGNSPQHYHGLLEFGEWPTTQRSQLCVPSPFFGSICLPSLPSLSRFLSPVRTLQLNKPGCVSIPLMTTEYVVKVCPSSETTQPKENSRETRKEIIKDEAEEEKEKESEPFSDNTIVQFDGKENEQEKFVEKERKDDRESQRENGDDNDDDVRNKIIQISNEIVQINKDANPPEPSPPMLPNDDDESDDESVNIIANLV